MTSDLRKCCDFIASQDSKTCRGRKRSARREKAEAIMAKHAMDGFDKGMSVWKVRRYARTKSLAEVGLSPQMWWLIISSLVQVIQWVMEWRKNRGGAL